VTTTTEAMYVEADINLLLHIHVINTKQNRFSIIRMATNQKPHKL